MQERQHSQLPNLRADAAAELGDFGEVRLWRLRHLPRPVRALPLEIGQQFTKVLPARAADIFDRKAAGAKRLEIGIVKQPGHDGHPLPELNRVGARAALGKSFPRRIH